MVKERVMRRALRQVYYKILILYRVNLILSDWNGYYDHFARRVCAIADYTRVTQMGLVNRSIIHRRGENPVSDCEGQDSLIWTQQRKGGGNQSLCGDIRLIYGNRSITRYIAAQASSPMNHTIKSHIKNNNRKNIL